MKMRKSLACVRLGIAAALAPTFGYAQLTDVSQMGATVPRGAIAESVDEQVAAGRGDVDTPQASIYLPDVSAVVRRVSQSDLAQGKNSGGGGDGIFIKRPYAYIAEGSGTTNAFQIFDISDPRVPVLISQSNLANGGNGVSTDDIWVTHGFAFIVEGGGTINALQVFNVTNPAAPVLVGQANLTNNAGDRLFVQGKYAYIVEGGSYTNSFEIFNVSNPAARLHCYRRSCEQRLRHL